MLKDKILGTVEIMSSNDLEMLWAFIKSNITTKNKTAKDYTGAELKSRLNAIPEAEPDEWDLKMIEEIKSNPDCNEFVYQQ